MTSSAAAPQPFPTRGALVGVDHGEKRIGLAVTDAAQTMALPLETIRVKTRALTLERLRQVAKDYRAAGWVLGLPMHMSGEEGTQAALVRAFGKWLSAETGLPVTYWDERLSSSAAEALLWQRGEQPDKRSGRIDGLAAQVMLDAYLRGRVVDE
jgi:putative Holliday junction resolvase